MLVSFPRRSACSALGLAFAGVVACSTASSEPADDDDGSSATTASGSGGAAQGSGGAGGGGGRIGSGGSGGSGGGAAGVARFGLGEQHTCAVMVGGALKCWGANGWTQLGTDADSCDAGSSPQLVPGLPAVREIALGALTTCALAETGQVHCWGQWLLGHHQTTPLQVAGLAGVTQIATGLGGHYCALDGSGNLRCWGSNVSGEVGTGTWGDLIVEPTLVLTGVASVALGTSHTCAVMNDATLRCWGQNLAAQVGTGSATGYIVDPTPVSGLSGVAQAALGSRHTCVVLTSGGVRCWGENTSGQLGLGFTSDHEATPTAVPGLTGVHTLAMKRSHGCALLTDGTVRCWGSNASGQLGLGAVDDQAEPQPVPGLAGVAEIAVGADHSCALSSDGSATCWGSNSCGKLGVSDAFPLDVPQPVSGL